MIPINLVQNRIANTSVGPSTLRGQPKGSVKKAINFLKIMSLNDYFNIHKEDEFLSNLNRQTNLLKNELPSQSWGFARKIINIFLLQATHDIYFGNGYNLKKIIPFLEVPLDNPNAKKLREFAKSTGIKLSWSNIKNLSKEDSDSLQIFAQKIAKEKYSCERCYLDYYFWRE